MRAYSEVPVAFPDFPLSKAVIELIGVVEESFTNATFRVRVTSDQAKDHKLHCHLAGRMRLHRVRILPGDRVKLEMTPYDLEKGRIVYRFRSDQIIPEIGKVSPPPASPLSSVPEPSEAKEDAPPTSSV